MSSVLPPVIAVTVGALVGSFLNVCIYRLPRHESILWPNSRCPFCAAPIGWYDNIPLLSYLLLKGRCRSCRAAVPRQYPIIELTNAVGYGAVIWWFGLGWPAAAYALLFSALLVITCIDLFHQIIPDVITLPGIAVGLLCASTVLPVGLVKSVLGIMLGGGLLWMLAWVSPYLFGKEGMGGGDIKLLAMIGSFLGWEPTLLTIMVGAVAGSVVGIGLIALRVMRRDQYLPFGPFLALGALVAMFFHQDLLAWYRGLLTGVW
jgi:leader peptidase (prepilin peptidase)/N-methyltransferase